MAWGMQGSSACYERYGFPLYCAAWVNLTNDEWAVLLGGGGLEGQRSIPGGLLLSKFNPNSVSLQRVNAWEGGTPHGIAMHPEQNVAFCSFFNTCSLFTIDSEVMTAADNSVQGAETAGLLSALAFNKHKSFLATGGEDGHLRLFNWSTGGLELKFHQTDAHTSVKDLTFSYDGTLLASLGSSGFCRVWRTDNDKLVPTINISGRDGEVFEFCRFSNKVLYLTSKQGENRMIVSWDCDCQMPKEKERKPMTVSDIVSAFDISADGKLFAVGTIGGDIVVLHSSNMSVLTVVKEAHKGLVTALAFNHLSGEGSTYLLSASVDTRARVTFINGKRRIGLSPFHLFMALLVVLAALVCFTRREDLSHHSSLFYPLLNFCNSGSNSGVGQAASVVPGNEWPAT